MRLLRALLALYHARRASRLQRLADAHGAKADALLDLARSRRQSDVGAARGLHPVALILLASIVGLAICGVWIWISARAGL